MTTRWKPWRALRARSDVEYSLADLPETVGRGVCYDYGDVAVILIDRALDPVERLAVLAHELVHLERGGSGQQPDLPAMLRPLVTREEARVERIVADRLVPLGELAAFVARRVGCEGCATAVMVAEYFDVTEQIATLALQRLAERKAA